MINLKLIKKDSMVRAKTKLGYNRPFVYPGTVGLVKGCAKDDRERALLVRWEGKRCSVACSIEQVELVAY